MKDLYMGRGNYDQFDDYMDFINYVFGFNGNEKDMKKLLPKLYRKELSPASDNFIVAEEGKLKAAVGVYPSEICVCETPLTIAGIGNVAVHPYERSKGYMKKLMGLAQDHMKQSGADLSILGGQRQRYNYFSYEQGGICYIFYLTRTNLRHAFGEEKASFTVKEVCSGDDAALDVIHRLNESDEYTPIRDRAELYQILCSWQARPYIIKDGDRIVGYFVLSGHDVTEIRLAEETDFIPALHGIMEFVLSKDSILHVKLPPFQTAYIRALGPIADKIQTEHCKMFSVLHFGKVIEAFLKLKASYSKLPDGEWKVLIHGIRGDEYLHITVSSGNVCVAEFDAAVAAGDSCIANPDCTVLTEEYKLSENITELTHLEAMRCFFGPVCTGRLELPVHVQSWLPLPLWIYAADCV